MELTLRKSNGKDLKSIINVENKSYPFWLRASEEVLNDRLRKGGIIVAETLIGGRERIVGFTTFVPAFLGWPAPDIEKIMRNRHPSYEPWFDGANSGMAYDTLWVASTAVETEFQRRGVGSALVKETLKEARTLNLSYRASALKCEYSTKGLKNHTIDDYLACVKNGEIKDRFLSLYLNLGFELQTPMQDYESPHPRLKDGTRNYNILAFKVCST
jgi:GNAT superfamily N-acetyltransferase